MGILDKKIMQQIIRFKRKEVRERRKKCARKTFVIETRHQMLLGWEDYREFDGAHKLYDKRLLYI